MGGMWIPKSFVEASPDLFNRLATVINPDDWYSAVIVRPEGAEKLHVEDAEGSHHVAMNDELIEVFQVLKSLGDEAVIVFDRRFRRCWTTTQKDAEAYVEYTKDIDDDMT